MTYCYSNDGFSMRAVDASYVPEAGEVVFQGQATEAQLVTAFPNRQGIEATSLYNALYGQVNAKTEVLIGNGAAFTNSKGEKGIIHCDGMAQTNALSFAINQAAIIALGGTWDNDFDIPFATTADVTAYCTAIQTCVATRRAEGKNLRETLVQASGETTAAWLARLQAFQDTRS